MKASSGFALALTVVLALAAGREASSAAPVARKGRTPVKRYTTEAWIAAAEKAFARERAERKPGGVIFPVVDEKGKVRADGWGAARAALLQVAGGQARRVAVSPGMVEEVLDQDGSKWTGAVLDADTVKICCRAADARWHVLSRLTARGRGYELAVAFHGDGADLKDREEKYDVAFDRLREVPGLIAGLVLEQLGLAPARQDGGRAEATEQDKDFLILCDLWGHAGNEPNDATLMTIAGNNRNSAFAWDTLLRFAKETDAAVIAFTETRPPVDCRQVQVEAARRLRATHRPGDALILLLKVAASEHGDPAYHAELVCCAMDLKDDRLTAFLLQAWEKAGDGYAHRLERGDCWTTWAWQARGGGWAGTVAPDRWRPFKERLERAKKELELALAINPDGWTAHVSLLTVARGLSLPRTYMEDHFARAIKLRPRSYGAYWARLEYLKPRWHGSRDDLLAVGRQLLDTGLWDRRVPRLVGDVLWDLSADLQTHAVMPGEFRKPEVWDLVRDYYRAAYRQGLPDDRREALNYLALWGVYGGHYDDAALALQKLGYERVRHDILGEETDVAYLRELVHARTGRLKSFHGFAYDRDLAAIGIALAEGDLDEADRLFKGLAKVNTSANSPTVTKYQAALKLGRRLQAERTVRLSPEEILSACISDKFGWRVADKVLVGDLTTRGGVSFDFPLGLKKCVITGTVAWEGTISHVEVRAHTRAPCERVVMRYLPADRVVYLLRQLRREEEVPIRGSSQSFRLEFSPGSDVLQPYPGVEWQTKVYVDTPSGFGFKAGRGRDERAGWIYLSDLQIERRD